MNDAWIAGRMKQTDVSGIRKAFDMAKSMVDPINLSIGLPDFDVAEPVKQAAIEAIEAGHNAYTVTQGIAELRGKIQAVVDKELQHRDRQVLITAGSSGALLLSICSVIDPGDELITFDPCFMMYRHLCTLAGGRTVFVDTYPDFRIDAAKVERAITSRTKCIVVNSPASPTGAVTTAEDMRALAELCRRRDILLISDEVYRAFCYDRPFATPATWNEDVLVATGFSKSHGMTGWRLGYAHGPSRLIQEMAKLQQFSFVCAPEHGAARRGCGCGPGLDRPDCRLSPQARHGGRRAFRPVRAGASGRRVLRLSASTMGQRERVRGRGDQAECADDSGQRVLTDGHSLPDLVRS